jgi:uncharacterized membrane protein
MSIDSKHMSEWFYAKGGAQSGPVSFEQLRQIASSGGIDAKDLVWTSHMKDWQPAGEVEGLLAPSLVIDGQPAPDPSNPYAAPQSTWNEPVTRGDDPLAEIIPGSDPIDVAACVKRGFELTKRNFGMILLVGLVYVLVYFTANLIFTTVGGLVLASMQSSQPDSSMAIVAFTAVFQIFSMLFSLYLGLGMTRVGLNLVSGKEVSVGQLFGEGGKLMRMTGASIIYYAMVFLGLLLFIVPGIYLALRFMYYQTAIVDRNMGVIESLSYSSSITTNNRLNLFLLGILGIAIVIAGFLALVVGLVFAMPIVWLSWMVAYRWMQHGRLAAEDHPETTLPRLSGV